jgi:hypothetical protein
MNSQMEYQRAFQEHTISKFWLEASSSSESDFMAFGTSEDNSQQNYELPNPENIRFQYE